MVHTEGGSQQEAVTSIDEGIHDRRSGWATSSTMGAAAASPAFHTRHVPSKELDSSARGIVGQNSTKDTTFVCPASTAFDSPSSPASISKYGRHHTIHSRITTHIHHHQ